MSVILAPNSNLRGLDLTWLYRLATHSPDPETFCAFKKKEPLHLMAKSMLKQRIKVKSGYWSKFEQVLEVFGKFRLGGIWGLCPFWPLQWIIEVVQSRDWGCLIFCFVGSCLAFFIIFPPGFSDFPPLKCLILLKAFIVVLFLKIIPPYKFYLTAFVNISINIFSKFSLDHDYKRF